jgi:L-seryl-tRNA(Ser) seleniumtransferase
MLTAPAEELQARAERLAAGTGGEVIESVARVGGGALPLLELRGPAVALPASLGAPDALAAALRAGDPPIVARISADRVLLDPRTLTDVDADAVIASMSTSAR